MRVTPASPGGPPKLIASALASASEKFELAWPASSPPKVAYAKRSRGTRLLDDKRHRVKRAVVPDIGGRGGGLVWVAAVEEVQHMHPDLAADPDRGVGAGD